jgi:hypothetical protein
MQAPFHGSAGRVQSARRNPDHGDGELFRIQGKAISRQLKKPTNKKLKADG